MNSLCPALPRLRVGIVLAAALLAGLARAEPVFSGYFVDATGPVFSLTSEGGRDARWVSLGESFDGYKVTAFDRAAQKLTLVREGRTVEVRLRAAQVQDSRLARRAYLRTLRGLALAQELAKDGDVPLGDLLKRRQQVLDQQDGTKTNRYALDYLNERIGEIAAARAADLAKEP